MLSIKSCRNSKSAPEQHTFLQQGKYLAQLKTKQTMNTCKGQMSHQPFKSLDLNKILYYSETLYYHTCVEYLEGSSLGTKLVVLDHLNMLFSKYMENEKAIAIKVSTELSQRALNSELNQLVTIVWLSRLDKSTVFVFQDNKLNIIMYI